MTRDEFLTTRVHEACRRLTWWALGVYYPTVKALANNRDLPLVDHHESSYAFSFEMARDKVSDLVLRHLERYELPANKLPLEIPAIRVAEMLVLLHQEVTQAVIAEACEKLSRRKI